VDFTVRSAGDERVAVAHAEERRTGELRCVLARSVRDEGARTFVRASRLNRSAWLGSFSTTSDGTGAPGTPLAQAGDRALSCQRVSHVNRGVSGGPHRGQEQEASMSRTRTVSESIVIAVDPDVVYRAVSDPRRMGRWSPENTGAVVEGPYREAYVGTWFIGSDGRGPVRWRTRCTVTTADQSKHFAFEVCAIEVVVRMVEVPIAAWAFRLHAVDGGTRVVQTWEDRRVDLPEPIWEIFDRVVLAGKTFPEHHRANMREALRRLKDDLEYR
jgi:uncharacterized protein YndB with AHSA1/START domain